jgi:hypothetical protein
MAKSIRISDELYELAGREAGLMHRSLAQQLEHWVRLGVGLELSGGATIDDVRSAAVQYRHARDQTAVRHGKRSAASLHAIPAELAKSAHADFPADAFASGKKAW